MSKKSFSTPSEPGLSIFEQIVSIIAVSSVATSAIINLARMILPVAIILAPTLLFSQSSHMMSEAEFISSMKYLSSPVIIRDTVVLCNNNLASAFNLVPNEIEQDIANVKAVMLFILLLVTAILFISIKIFYTLWRFVLKSRPTSE